MADPNSTPNISSIGRTYTYSEAIEYIKEQNKKPVDMNKPSTRWVDSRTGREVVIGVTGG